MAEVAWERLQEETQCSAFLEAPNRDRAAESAIGIDIRPVVSANKIVVTPAAIPATSMSAHGPHRTVLNHLTIWVTAGKEGEAEVVEDEAAEVV